MRIERRSESRAVFRKRAISEGLTEEAGVSEWDCQVAPPRRDQPQEARRARTTTVRVASSDSAYSE